MSDFYQTGNVTTLHRLKDNHLERLESDLEKYTRNRPVGLVLPALYSEFETIAMQRIVTELRQVRYLQRIVLALGRATQEQMRSARSFFRNFYTPVDVIWVESPRIQPLFRKLEERGRAGWRTAICWRRGTATSSRCTIATS
jgi:glucosyl-3-phosphoglycerate synthase